MSAEATMSEEVKKEETTLSPTNLWMICTETIGRQPSPLLLDGPAPCVLERPASPIFGMDNGVNQQPSDTIAKLSMDYKKCGFMSTIQVQMVGMEACLPKREHPGSFVDYISIYANLDRPLTLLPGRRARIPLGFTCIPPIGTTIRVESLYNLALQFGVSVLAAEIVILPDVASRSESSIVLFNSDATESFYVNHGDKVGHMILEQHAVCPVLPVKK